MAALRSPKRLRTEVLAGLVVALALIPEAISFSIIAGVDPRVGLFASFTMAVTIAIVGGRPAMISAATGSVALVIAPLAGWLIGAFVEAFGCSVHCHEDGRLDLRPAVGTGGQHAHRRAKHRRRQRTMITRTVKAFVVATWL